MNTIRGLAAGTAVAALLVAGAVPADAKSGDVVRRGNCSGTAHWKLKVGPDNGRLEVEVEIDSNRAGQHWTWRIRHNGVLAAKGARDTAGASGSFTVRRVLANLAGTDTIVFRARRPATGQVCRGVVRF
jgi:hypothetical protein